MTHSLSVFIPTNSSSCRQLSTSGTKRKCQFPVGLTAQSTEVSLTEPTNPAAVEDANI